MPAQPGLLVHPAAESVRLLARPPLADADAAVRALVAEGAEASEASVHDLRVALRRVRSLLRAYEPQFQDTVTGKLRRRLRKLARRTGAVRDADVQIDWLRRTARRLPPEEVATVRALVARLHDRRRREMGRLWPRLEADWPPLHEALTAAFARFTAVAVVGAVPPLPTLAAVAAPLVREHAAAVALRMAAFAAEPGDTAAAHAARIAGKRLRYLLEPLAEELPAADELVGRLRRLQDALGAVQDAAVRIGTIGALADGSGSGGDGRAPGTAGAEAAAVWLPPALAAAMERAQVTALEAARRRWLPRVPRLLRAAAAVAGELEALGASGVEIERKYLLRRLPPRVRRLRPRAIEQGYLPGERLIERLRRVTAPDGSVRRYRTVKGGAGVARLEIEEEAEAQLFEALWPLTAGRRVLKQRYVVPDGPLRWEIDEFTDRELVLAEVELPDADTNPAPPGWLAPYVVREVTDEAAYLNASLAQ